MIAGPSRAAGYSNRGRAVCSPAVWMLCSSWLRTHTSDCFLDCRSHKSSRLSQEATSFWQVCLKSFATGCRSYKSSCQRQERRSSLLPYSLYALQQFAPLQPICSAAFCSRLIPDYSLTAGPARAAASAKRGGPVCSPTAYMLCSSLPLYSLFALQCSCS